MVDEHGEGEVEEGEACGVEEDVEPERGGWLVCFSYASSVILSGS